jgi:hypothetical protein
MTMPLTSRCVIFYQIGVVDHSRDMLEYVAMNSAEAEYNGACMACVVMSHMHMTLNHIEEVEVESKGDKPVDICMDNMHISCACA